MPRLTERIEARRRAMLDAIARADRADEFARIVILRSLDLPEDLELMVYIRIALAKYKELAQEEYRELEP